MSKNKAMYFQKHPHAYAGNLFIYIIFMGLLTFVGCTTTTLVNEPNYSEAAQKKIMNRDYEGARSLLSTWYEKTNLKTDKGAALYWIAYTHIKESSYKEARNFLETADKLYRNGPLLGAISSRIISCALNDGDEERALKQYRYIADKKVGEMSEIDFLMGRYYIKKSDLSNARVYLQKCVISGDNLFARKAKSILTEIADGGYYLQLGVYANNNTAKNIVHKLKVDFGLEAYIKEIKANDSIQFAVCLGSYNNRFEAEKEMRIYKSRYRDLEMIVRP